LKPRIGTRCADSTGDEDEDERLLLDSFAIKSRQSLAGNGSESLTAGEAEPCASVRFHMRSPGSTYGPGMMTTKSNRFKGDTSEDFIDVHQSVPSLWLQFGLRRKNCDISRFISVLRTHADHRHCGRHGEKRDTGASF
jgi:hypothetical protein